MAADPSFSIEGAWSSMGSHDTAQAAAAAAFVEALFDDHALGSTGVTWAPDVMTGWISGRDYPHKEVLGYTTRDDIWLVAAGVRLHYGDADAWYHPLFFSVQPTLHTGKTAALSGMYEFTLTIGWQARHWMFGVRHSSNAGLNGSNLGETMIVGGITF
jgi:hypothetical protein